MEKETTISEIVYRLEEIKSWVKKEGEAQKDELEKITYELEKLKKYVEKL